jgi:hypothetical protein
VRIKWKEKQKMDNHERGEKEEELPEERAKPSKVMEEKAETSRKGDDI